MVESDRRVWVWVILAGVCAGTTWGASAVRVRARAATRATVRALASRPSATQATVRALASRPSATQAVATRVFPPHRAVVLRTHLPWRSCHWAGPARNTDKWSQDMTLKHPRFTIHEPNKHHVWIYYLKVPVDVARYPVVVLTYRARRTKWTMGYVLWLDDGTGPNNGRGLCVLAPKDLVDDGRVREVSRDLRKYKPKGDIIGLALGATAGAEAPGVFDLMGLRFEAPSKAPARPAQGTDAPVRVRVQGPAGRPVAGASVTVDWERLNFARTVTTGATGQAQVVPLTNKSGTHTLHVEAPGMERMEVKLGPGRARATAKDAGPLVTVSLPAAGAGAGRRAAREMAARAMVAARLAVGRGLAPQPPVVLARDVGEVAIVIAEPGAPKSDTVSAIEAKLAKPVTLDFRKSTLADVTGFLRDFTGIAIATDEAALKKQGVSPKTAVSLKMAGVPLKQALRQLLVPLKLVYVIGDKGITITTQAGAESLGERAPAKDATPPYWTLSLTNKDHLRGQIDTIADAVVRFRPSVAPDTVVPVAVDKIRRLTFSHKPAGAAPAKGMTLRLRNNSLLYGRLVKLSDKHVRFDVNGIGPIDVPRAQAEELMRIGAAKKTVRARAKQHVVVSCRGDVLTGNVTQEADGVLVVGSSSVEAKLPVSSVSCVLFPSDVSVPAPAGTQALVVCADGTTLAGGDVHLKAGRLGLTLVDARRVHLPVGRVAEIAFMQHGTDVASRRGVVVWTRARTRGEPPNTVTAVLSEQLGRRWRVVEHASDRAGPDLERQSQRSRALVIADPVRWGGSSRAPRAAELKALANAFLKTGGNVVVLDGSGQGANLLRAAGLLTVGTSGSAGNGTVSFTGPGRALGQGIAQTFRYPGRTRTYQVGGATALAMVHNRACIVGRRIGRGWLILVGVPCDRHNKNTARLLSNAIRFGP